LRAHPPTFAEHHHLDESGRRHDYVLADRAVRIADDAKSHSFACRLITRLKDGHRDRGERTVAERGSMWLCDDPDLATSTRRGRGDPPGGVVRASPVEPP
jgi:hypothetical protein